MHRSGRKDPSFEFRISRDAENPCARACEVPGCAAPGDYKAPKSRDNLREFRWFCLDHVRAYNQSWNFFAGMNDDQISEFQRNAIIGHRPTWGFGGRHAPAFAAQVRPEAFAHKAYDVFTILDDGPAGSRAGRPQVEVSKRKLTKLQSESLAALGLEDDASLNDVKARYKELVKRYHPDANGGDRGAEDRLKQVIRAYGLLKSSGLR
ncbi:MAG: J domain-containing protein [Alphaproteobacteria bacterium]|nr:J domain-containing protein [Alphaproteobacteria bacterium]